MEPSQKQEPPEQPPAILDYRAAGEDRRESRGKLAAQLVTVVVCTGFGSVALFLVVFSNELIVPLIGVSFMFLLIAVSLFALNLKNGSHRKSH